MGNKKTEWEELGLSNDFLFGKVMGNPELCKETLETILGIAIQKIEYPERQKTVDEDKDARSVRLDLYVKDGKGSVYNVEMQSIDTKELPKRSRYYGSMIDLQELDKGEPYWNLKKSYVIFICTFDLFGEGRHRYTFENRCREDYGIALGDEAIKMFLNTEGTKEDIGSGLKAFLDYMGGRGSDSALVRKLDEEVNRAKKNREWRREYMTLLMRDQENIEKGRIAGLEQGRIEGLEQGLEQGENRYALLTQKLLQEKRYDAIGRIGVDKGYRQELYREYHIL